MARAATNTCYRAPTPRCTAGAQTMGQPTTPPAGALICVFVRLQKYGADRFYVLHGLWQLSFF